MRFDAGSRHECVNITAGDYVLNCVHQYRYLGTIVSSSLFKCSFSECRKSFYRACNVTFACIVRKASDEVIVELVTKKCFSGFVE